MAEGADYDPGPWAGHDFASARKTFDSHAGRSYDAAVSAGKTVRDLIPDSIKTNCERPLIIAADITGSMGEWPAVIFSKLPYLAKEGAEYLGEDFEISFMAVGDANSGYRDGQTRETYPLQVRPFAKSLKLEERLKELVIEGQGGGQVHETYELAALYGVDKVQMPKAIQPIFIFIGDEHPYDEIDSETVERLLGYKPEEKMRTKDVFNRLKEKFSVYLVRKPYSASGGDSISAEDKIILKHWVDLLGEDHICDLPEAQRVVDVIFGILAKETGRIAYFEEELTGRQDDKQIKTVYTSLRTVHQIPEAARASVRSGKSVMRRSPTDAGSRSGRSKPLV